MRQIGVGFVSSAKRTFDSIFFTKWKDSVSPSIDLLFYLKVPLSIAILSYVFFAVIEQTLEIYRNFAFDKNCNIIPSILFVFLLSVLVWHSARLLSLKHPDYDRKKGFFIWLPRILGICPLISLAFGFYKAAKEVSVSSSNWFLYSFSLLCFFLAILLLFITFYRTKWFCSDKWLGAITRDGLFAKKTENIFVTTSFIIFAAFAVPSMSSFLSLGTLAIVVLCLVIYTLLWFWNVGQDEQDRRWLLPMFAAAFSSIFLFRFIYSPVLLPNKLGSIIIFSLSLSILVIVASTIYDWGEERKFPALTFLIVLALFSSYLNLNDNHQFRQTFVEEVPELKSVDSQLGEWLSYRPDLEQYQKADKPYPVYIVSAQGGGIFAAYHTAITLSRLQDLSPQFAQHILAISSVSGGSLGATIFSSLVKEYVDNNKPNSYCPEEPKSCLEYKAKQILDRDFLSPLLAAGLFPDFVQRFIPFKIRQWDRARNLEYSLEESWKAIQSDNNPFQQSYYQAWNPQKIAPALVINTTVEETGERLLLSPFKIAKIDRNIRFYRQNIDLNLSTAAVLSARFPFVTPLGWFRGDDEKQYRLADGGYFDNSGVTTAVEIDSTLSSYLSEFQQSELKEKLGIIPEIIHLSIVSKFDKPNSKDNKDKGLNEIASPIRTFFNVRQARGKSVIQEADQRYNQEKTDYIFEVANDLSSTKSYNPFKDKFRKFLLDKDTEQGKLPLGWLLSDNSQKLIDNQSGIPAQCSLNEFLKDVAQGEAQENYSVNNHNSCISKSVIDELDPQILSPH